MDIKFPTQEDPFGKTMAKAVVCCLIALCLGIFLGNALGAFLGTDESVLTTSAYTDNMSATRSMFTDPDQMNSYMDAASGSMRWTGSSYTAAGTTSGCWPGTRGSSMTPWSCWGRISSRPFWS